MLERPGPSNGPEQPNATGDVDWTALELLRYVAASLQYVLLQDHTTHSAI